VALVYNVLKAMMQMNSKLFDDLTNNYKADKQKLVVEEQLASNYVTTHVLARTVLVQH
jgi:hypothetical protein